MPKPIDNSSVALAIGESDKRLESTKSQIEDLMKNMDALLTNKNDLKLLEDLLKATKSGLNTAANTAIVTYMNNAAQAMIQKNIERSVALQADLLTSLSRGDDYKYLRDAGYTFSASGDMIVGSRLTYNGLFKVNGLAYEDASYSPVFSGQFISIATKFNPPAMNIDLFGGDADSEEFSASAITNAQENLRKQEEAITKAYEKFKNKTVEVREKYTVNEDLKRDKEKEFTKTKNESLNSFTKFVNDTSNDPWFSLLKMHYEKSKEYTYEETAQVYKGKRKLKGQVNVQTSYGPIPVDVDYGEQQLDVATKVDPKTIGFEYSLNGEGTMFIENKFREAKVQFSKKVTEKVTEIQKIAVENDKEKDSKGFLFSFLGSKATSKKSYGRSDLERGDFGRSDYGRFVKKTVLDIAGYTLGAVDLLLGQLNPILGQGPAAYVTFEHGGIGIHNSYFANNGTFGPRGSYVDFGPIAHFETGASRQVVLHEFGHVAQNRTGYDKGFRSIGTNIFIEMEADIKAGTANYPATIWLIETLYGRDAANTAMLYNMAMADPKKALEYALTIPLSESARDAVILGFILDGIASRGTR